jgi:hypothetical protein
MTQWKVSGRSGLRDFSPLTYRQPLYFTAICSKASELTETEETESESNVPREIGGPHKILININVSLDVTPC